MLFDRIYSTGYNLHNTAEFNKRTEFDFIARFMGEASIEASYKMNVQDKDNRFQFIGHMEELSTGSLNRILEPLAGVETGGQIYGLGFNILANDSNATGTVDFEYDDLKIKVLRPDSDEKNVLLSVISNLTLRRSNVITDQRFRQGRIDFERDSQKSLFGYVWDALKDGLMDTLIPFELEKSGEGQRIRLFRKRSKS